MRNGDKLRNGATVIAFSTSGSGSVVLAKFDNGVGTEFVTWQVGPDDSTFWGHYFRNLKEAKEDYFERVEKVCGR